MSFRNQILPFHLLSDLKNKRHINNLEVICVWWINSLSELQLDRSVTEISPLIWEIGRFKNMVNLIENKFDIKIKMMSYFLPWPRFQSVQHLIIKHSEKNQIIRIFSMNPSNLLDKIFNIYFSIKCDSILHRNCSLWGKRKLNQIIWILTLLQFR